jgi:hypothetical protein
LGCFWICIRDERGDAVDGEHHHLPPPPANPGVTKSLRAGAVGLVGCVGDGEGGGSGGAASDELGDELTLWWRVVCVWGEGGGIQDAQSLVW